jgi:serine protease Do
VPIHIATAILPQLRANGRVSRGYIGVALREIDTDLQQSLKLPVRTGALVQDVTAGSPAERAGLRPYDVIVALDGKAQENDHQLIRDISAQSPGTTVRLHVVREGRDHEVMVKLAERPSRDRGQSQTQALPSPALGRADAAPLGLTVRDIDRLTADRLALPDDTKGVLIMRVEPLSSAADGDINRGTVLLEINRHAVASADEYRRIAATLSPGEIATFFLYSPELDQRQLKTVRVEDR